MQKVREKAMLLQDMHQLWCEKEKDTVSCWFAKHFKTGEEKRINNAGKRPLDSKRHGPCCNS